MTFIPADKHKFIARWGLPLLAGFSSCMGLVGAQNTLAVWDRMSERETLARVSSQNQRLQNQQTTEQELLQIQQRDAISQAHREAKILDYSCGTKLNNFQYNPGSVDGDLIAWGIDATDPIYNPRPGFWHPIYAESGHLVAAVRDGSIITIDTFPGMDAGAMCSNGQID